MSTITILLDGLYPNGPAIKLCKDYNWNYMMVSKDNSLSSVWEEAYGLKKLETGNTLNQIYKDRTQYFWWVNNIDYYYGNNDKHHLRVNVVVCEESVEEVDHTGEIVKKFPVMPGFQANH